MSYCQTPCLHTLSYLILTTTPVGRHRYPTLKMRKLRLLDVKRRSQITQLKSGSTGIRVQFCLTPKSIHPPSTTLNCSFLSPKFAHLQNKGVESTSDAPHSSLTVWPSVAGERKGNPEGVSGTKSDHLSPTWESTGTLCPICTVLTPWPMTGSHYYWQHRKGWWDSQCPPLPKETGLLILLCGVTFYEFTFPKTNHQHLLLRILLCPTLS